MIEGIDVALASGEGLKDGVVLETATGAVAINSGGDSTEGEMSGCVLPAHADKRFAKTRLAIIHRAAAILGHERSFLANMVRNYNRPLGCPTSRGIPRPDRPARPVSFYARCRAANPSWNTGYPGILPCLESSPRPAAEKWRGADVRLSR
jgi:hypothetical protein